MFPPDSNHNPKIMFSVMGFYVIGNFSDDTYSE